MVKIGGGYIRARCDVEVSNRADTVKTILECGKRRGLREQHEQSVKALVEVRIFLRFEELDA
jgi:hypothetical protein